MSFKMKNRFFYTIAAVTLFLAGWACSRYGNNAGISDGQVVATVNGHDITFGDWMRQVDMTRVFVASMDPSSSQDVKAVLSSLIDQQLVLDAAQKDKFSDSRFDEDIKKKILDAKVTIHDTKDKLEKDLAAINRLDKDFEDPYKRMLLAQRFALTKLDTVVVTEKDLRDWYSRYAAQAAAAGQKVQPYEVVRSKIAAQVKPMLQREKYVTNLESEGKVDKKNEVIEKYLNSLSASQQLLDSKGLPPDTKDTQKKPATGTGN